MYFCLQTQGCAIWWFLIVDDNVSTICFWRNIVVWCYSKHSISCSSGHCAYSQSQKYIISMCFKDLPVKRFIHALVWRALFLSLYTWRALALAFAAHVLSNWWSCFLNLQVFFSICSPMSSLCHCICLYNREIILAALLKKIVKPTWQRIVIKSWNIK